MHILGKVFAWMLVPLAAAGMVLMARDLQVRNSYAAALRDADSSQVKGPPSLREEVKKNAALIEQKRQELEDLKHEYAVVTHGWNQVWDRRSAVAERLGPGRPPTLAIQAGTRDGIGEKVTSSDPNVTLRRHLVLHMFRLQPNGPSAYVGRFKLLNPAEIQPTQVRAYPDWVLRGGDFAMWENAPAKSWRIRASIPPQYDTAFTQSYLDLESLDQDLAQAREQDAQAAAALQEATDYVNSNRAILAGPNGMGGLVRELANAEEARDAELDAVDALRRRRHRLVLLRDALAAENVALAKKLPQPAESGSP